MTPDHQQSLQEAMLVLLKLVQDESDFSNFFVVLEDLAIHCLQNDQQLFHQNFFTHFKQFLSRISGQNIQFLKYSSNLLKTMICLSGPEFK